MRNWIAGAVTVLGILLVLGGAGTTLLRTWWKPGPGDRDPAPATGPTPAQQQAAELFGPTGVPPVPASSAAAPATAPAPARPVFRLEAAERLIVWGIVLLVLAAVSAGAIGFDLSANAPVR